MNGISRSFMRSNSLGSLSNLLNEALNSSEPSGEVKVFAALQYGLCSVGIMFANKIVLTSYGFPSFAFLTLSQFVTTVCVLCTLKAFKLVSFPDHDIQMFGRVFPLQFLFLFSTVLGLGGTKHVSMPMFVMLRRFTVLFTMIMEYFVAGIKPSPIIAACVGLLCLGAMVACSDFTASTEAVLMILTANLCQALTQVVSKQKLDVKEGVGTVGLLMYNSFYSMLLFLPFWTFGKLHAELEGVLSFEHWNEPWLVFLFLFSCFMASLLNFSLLMCTKVNGALSTMIVGVLKNVITTYAGMFVGHDYVFTITNFTGLNVSMLGSLIYTYLKYQENEQKKQAKAAPKEAASPSVVASPSSVKTAVES
ncbi:hypothetical protein CYMTET_30521 [Cymbomonas tetramitiformis]|uniref:Sugar phosphate transporter domain-containing protein n=1 Tax=Cymbomonas tetramitiformis TaxID=36881 RepID=A0AAE0KTU6_9CHLO|nr:hypothetical protein CYMTET_45833 [Cymbomonas tetramitiformis]KAK3260521.1 hypothetical protein CYMTET_30521 [Cymbomonas tetramitiformis]|eukprot:gene16020-19001_t